MDQNLVPICLLAAGLLIVPVQAEIKVDEISDTGQDLTADELSVQAQRFYAEGKYAEAVRDYQHFLTNFGQAEEAREAVRSITPRLALSLLQLQKFSEARTAIAAALALEPPIDPPLRTELIFWQGICEMQGEEYEAAGKTLKEFLGLFPPGAERNPSLVRQTPAIRQGPEARMLIGSCLLLEGKFLETADYFAGIKPSLDAAMRGRATVWELYALLQGKAEDRAMALVMEEFPRMNELLQLVTFQTLTLELGSRYLQRGELRKAIICLQRVWPSERLRKHQQDRLAELEAQRQAAEANPTGDPYTKFLLGRMTTNVRREVENFQKIENFDSALRMRLAMAYQSMKRYRESALIMEAMLKDMPPDPIVESASVNLVQSWNAIERWPKTIEAAEAFAEKFPQSKNGPLVWYLKGIAEQKALDYDAAVTTFAALTKKFPKSEFAPRAQFMKGFSHLLAEDHQKAIKDFEKFPQDYPKHKMLETAAYWRGMAYSLDHQYLRCREVMEEYLDQFKDGPNRGAAIFRQAYCAQQLEDYRTSIKELTSFLRKFPGHEKNSEARILLGDALMNEGRMEEGIAALSGISPKDVRFYEDGVFKVGKAYKLMEEPDKLLAHMKAFKEGYPRSTRVAEAIYQMGWVYRQRDQPDKARDLYWEAIAEYGNDPGIRSVDDLFPALVRLYKGPEARAQYLARLRDLTEEARRQKKAFLVLRTLWAQGNAWKKSDPEQAQALFLEAAKLADIQTTNPLLLADFAQALLAAGKKKEGERMWRDLLKWNPRAPQKDQAFAALGMLELERGHEKAALKWFDRFEEETLGSSLFGKILLAKAQLLEKRGQLAGARQSLEVLLGNQFSGGQEKAEALYLMGEWYLKEGKPGLAVPYFQRIYVMHGRWRDWVARAYLASGQAFEKLHDDLSARRTYQELTEREDFADYQETATARKRLEALGGPLPKEEEPAKG